VTGRGGAGPADPVEGLAPPAGPVAALSLPAAEGKLGAAASLAFLLLIATLPWSIAPISIALAIAGVLTALLWARDRTWPPLGPLTWPAAAWGAALLVAAWFAEDRAASLSRIGKGMLPLLFAVGVHHARDRMRGSRVLAVLGASAVAAALFGLLPWLVRGASYPDRALGPVGHYMTFAGQLLLWLPVACGVAICARGPAWRWGARAATLVGLATLAATFTRSAWLGLFVALAVLLALTRRRWLVALFALAALGTTLAPAPYRARLASAFDPAHPTNVERRHMWDAGLRMFRDRPLTGVGLQDLHAAYDRYRSPASRERAGHLHNVVVQIAATMGIVGLAAFVWLYATLIRAAASGLRTQLARGGLAAGVRAGVVAALAGFLVAGLFEWNFGDEELLDLLYPLVGIAWAARGWPEERA